MKRKIIILGAMYVMMYLSLAQASVIAIVFDGYVSDNGLGESGDIYGEGNMSFALTDFTETYETSDFVGGGTVTVPETLNAAGRVAIGILLKTLLDMGPVYSTDPETFTERTNETFDGSFSVDDPYFQFDGTFTRTASLFDVSFDATFQAGFPDLTGYATAEGLLTPLDPGFASETATIHAEMSGGGFYDYTIETVLSFDSTLSISQESSQVEYTINEEAGEWDCVGTATISVPEPTTLCLLGLGGLVLRRKRRA